MSTEPFGDLSLTSAQRLDRLCRQFEKGWQSGDRPLLEDFVAKAPETERSDLLKELLYLEIEIRRQAHEPVQLEDYLHRFPSESALVTQVWGRSGLAGAGVPANADATGAYQPAGSRCPNEQELKALNHGQLRQDEIDRLAGHLDTCLQCQTRLQSLSCGAASLPGQIRQDMQQTETHISKDSEKTAARPDLPTHAGRYRIVGEVARGGMGAVLRAQDPVFNRTVAVKIMLGRHQGRPELETRFFDEAKITGQLQHPGIPPVHELGRVEDGRAFFAMKLIDGRTLDDLLQERSDRRLACQTEATGEPPVATELPRFVGIFEQICQTIAYAHSRGILHRDLKPLNIMVGAFGEVQVMDWGLAKVVSGQWSVVSGSETPVLAAEGVSVVPSDDSFPSEKPRTTDHGLRTREGVVMGTPAYMAPEQARGEIDQLDERCDVFGLGAILCRILTGEPPFTGNSAAEVIERASQGDLTNARQRLQACGADAELIALALDCLAPSKDERPENAGAVAQTISAYQERLQQRLQQAEIERAQSATKAIEERKRRRVWLGLAATLLLLVVSAAGVALWYQSEQFKETERLQRLEQDTNRSIVNAKDFMSRRQFADAGKGLEQAQARFRAHDPVALRDRVERWRRDWQLARNLDQIRLDLSVRVKGEYLNSQAAAERYAALLAPAGLGRAAVDDIAKAADWIQQSHIKDYLMSALEDWAAMTKKQPLDDQASIAKKLEQRRWLLAVVCTADPHPERNRLRDAELWENPAALKVALGETDVSQLSAPLIEALALQLGIDSPEGLQLLRQGRRIHPQDFWLNCVLANCLRYNEKYQEQLAYYLVASVLRPNLAMNHINLGVAYADLEERDKAIEQYNLALAIDPKNVHARSNIGHSYIAKGELDKAIKQFNKALKIDPNFVPAYNDLGNTYAAKGAPDKAIEHYNLALKCKGKYAKTQHATAHYNLGVIYEGKKDVTKATKHYNLALAIDSSNGPARNNLGVIYLRKKELTKAREQFEKALTINPKDAVARFNLGKAYRDKGQLDKAIEHFQLAISLNPKLASFHTGLANAYADNRQLDKAIEHYKMALKINPKNAKTHYNLGVTYGDKRQLDKAIEHYKLAIKIDPKKVGAHINLGNAYGVKGQPKLAIEHFKAVVQIDPKDAHAHGAMGQALLELGKFAEARKSIVQALRLFPANSPQYRVSQRQLQQCERLLSQQTKDSKIQAGKGKKVVASIQGNLAKGDPLDNFPFTKKSYHKAHSVKLEQGKTYLMDLKGSFDTFLRIEDAEKKPLLFNDDAGPPADLNSRLIFAPKTTQKFRLIVTSYKPAAVGTYSLQVREAAPSGKPNMIEDKLTTKDKNNGGKFFKMHKVELKGGKAHILQMESKEFDTFIVLVDAKSGRGLAQNGAIAPGNTKLSRIDFTPKTTGTYFVVTTSYGPGATGDYTLRVQRYELAKK